MRGTLYLAGDEVMPDSKVNTILKVARTLHPDRDVVPGPPKGNYHIGKDAHREDLVRDLHSLLKVTRGGKKKKRGMGFVSLHTDGEGHFWFKSGRSFHGAINASLESLEVLADDLGDDLPEEASRAYGEAYRRIERLFY